MILYRTDTWNTQIFRFQGTVWPQIWKQWLAITLYVITAYAFCQWNGANLGKMKGNFLGSVLSFLLVFRANQSYSRYWQGRTIITHLFSDLREVITVALIFLPGGQRGYAWRWHAYRQGVSTGSRGRDAQKTLEHYTDQFDDIVSEERVDVVRWALILGISVQMHARIVDELERGDLSADLRWIVNWDRYRIRCLTTKLEFQELDRYVTALAIPQAAWDDSPMDGDLEAILSEYHDAHRAPDGGESIEVSTIPQMRLPVAAIYRLSEVLFRNVCDARLSDRKYLLAERFFTVFSGRMLRLNTYLSHMTQIISTPLPFPYYHLCKTLLFMYFLSFPFLIDVELGLWANIGELSCLSIALLGLDAIATELENPFGCDANDLSIADDIFKLEKELLYYTQQAGDRKLFDSFVWQDAPAVLSESCIFPVKGFLALRTQVESNGRSKEVYPFKRVAREVSLDAEEMPEDMDVLSEDS